MQQSIVVECDEPANFSLDFATLCFLYGLNMAHRSISAVESTLLTRCRQLADDIQLLVGGRNDNEKPDKQALSVSLSKWSNLRFALFAPTGTAYELQGHQCPNILPCTSKPPENRFMEEIPIPSK